MARRVLVPPPTRCDALARSTGKPCRRWAVPGAKRCRLHGAYAGRGGRAHAEDLHAVRQIEYQVTRSVSETMAAAGFPIALIQAAAGHLGAAPPPDPDEESRPAEVDEEAAIEASMVRLAERLIEQFQGVALELAAGQAQAAAQRPQTLEGAVVPEPAPAAPAAPESDPVAEEIERLERRPTARRMARAVQLRRPRELPPVSAADVTPEPDPGAPSEPELRLDPGSRTVSGEQMIRDRLADVGSYRTFASRRRL